MCGIAGIYNYADQERPVDRDLLTRMTRTLAHRGPDGEGFHIDGPIGLGHRRLAILDLSPSGAQPMPNEDRSSWIVYNGEFYNHETFRGRLTSRGHRFRSRSDTETLLHLLDEDGPDALAGVAAIFGLAYWNQRNRELILARDPMGVKQVYYYDDGRRILFASEIKALLEAPELDRAIDLQSVNQYLHFHTSLFDRTFFLGVRQVRAGEYLRITPHSAHARQYWAIRQFDHIDGTSASLTDDLRQRLQSVIADQLMADVPVGAFFSGGIDSSAVAAFAARSGITPRCFGIHFTDQGVIDERPYQEAAAKALGLDLSLIALDGSTFPEDLMRLMYHQDQPVIGPAMFPMYHVSRLAAGNVKVCLGGQAADEIFGGYARYALTQPSAVIMSWFSGRDGAADGASGGRVGGNLGRQLVDRRNLRRLLHSARSLGDWEARYFDTFAKVPETAWKELFTSPELVNRTACRQMFRDVIHRSPATDPADKIMHWDAQTYLTGLFHQDDRMSMAVGLESRVPIADPRLVEFAFQLGFNRKFRGGSTKWLLRRAVSGLLPDWVLNRRKVGFDTPVENWVRHQHSGFVHDLLLSSRARTRGLWNTAGVERLLANPQSRHWIDRIWKIIAIESWVHLFLDQTSHRPLDTPRYCVAENPAAMLEGEPGKTTLRLRDAVQEVRELGVRRTLSRVVWEAQTRTALKKLRDRGTALVCADLHPEILDRCFADPRTVAAMMRPAMQDSAIAQLRELTSLSSRGKILCFSRWFADFGNPIDWHVHPLNSRRWPASEHWSTVLNNEGAVGDVKLTWEAARFPHAYWIARAAAFNPGIASMAAGILDEQVASFRAANPFPLGVHWSSGQEIVFRLMAWCFALRVFRGLNVDCGELARHLAADLTAAAEHLSRNIQYARDAVYNNHLLSEALGLLMAATLVPEDRNAAAWHAGAVDILTLQAERQFYPDGSYIQQSHNYHRVAIHVYLWARQFMPAAGKPIPETWTDALGRSLRFLIAHQNPSDGRLPNYGSNDGALPSILSTCDYSDFRPTLQAVSVLVDGRRLYEPGPWDEAAAWFFGPDMMQLPVTPPIRCSQSFAHSGYHVLRGTSGNEFCAFRCGDVLDRFSQIDMLNLDVWWRGLNVLVDAGSYLYNGPAEWHNHFYETGCHNTISVDGRNQMKHHRRFKNLYWTRARLQRFEEADQWALCEGEHYGFARDIENCVHSRSVLFVKDDAWIVVDRIAGGGTRQIRLHWLCGDFPYRYSARDAELTLETPRGEFRIITYDASGRALPGDVERGSTTPPRGWTSRYYGEKTPAPSLAVTAECGLPATFVSVLTPVRPRVSVDDRVWTVTLESQVVRFAVRAGQPVEWEVLESVPAEEDLNCVS